MTEFKTITEYQLLRFAYHELLRRIDDEEKKNKRFFAENKRQNRICLNRVKMYTEQFNEIRERIIEIETERENNAYMEK